MGSTSDAKQTNSEPSLEVSQSHAFGIAARVIRGGAWNVSAQTLALLTSLVTTPFVIRLLGTEEYGLLTLVNLLTSYFGFADLGMGVASTKFAAEASAREDEPEESRVVWTSVLISLFPVLTFAAMFVFGASALADGVFRLPQDKHTEAVAALRVAAVVLVATAASGVFNTPQIVRLRVGLNSAITLTATVTQVCLILTALCLGGRLLAVVGVMGAVAVSTACVHFFVSSRLLPTMLKPVLDRRLIRPMARFGMGVVASAVIGTVTVHGEKFLLARFASVSMLAYYNVAFTLAGLLGMVPAATSLPLMPSLVQLKVSGNHEGLERLYRTMLRLLVFWTLPAALGLSALAHPFFTLWAGPGFGRESTLPFYILAIGWLFQSASSVPRCVLSAWGRVELIARYQAFEMVPYVIVVVILIGRFGVVGAAAAWGLRALVECFLVFRAARRLAGFSYSPFREIRGMHLVALGVLSAPLVLVAPRLSLPVILIPATMLSIVGYSVLIFRRLLSDEERDWVKSLWSRFLRQ